MKTMIHVAVIVFLLVGLWNCPPRIAAAETSDNVTVQLDVAGETLNMSGAQTVPMTGWSRFHLAFGDGRAQIRTTQEFDLDAPPPTEFGRDDQKIECSVSISVQFDRGFKQEHGAKIIIQTATKENGKWIFTREEDNTAIPPDHQYKFTIVNGASGEELACVLTIPGDSFLGMREILDPHVVTDVTLDICHLLNKVTGKTKKQLLNHNQRAVFRNLSDWWNSNLRWETEFRETVPLPDGDSCYHFVTVVLADAGFNKGGSTLLGTFEIDLETVFGSDSHIDATNFSADVIHLDDFKKDVRLRNGKAVEIQIPADEASHFPFPVVESFIIIAKW